MNLTITIGGVDKSSLLKVSSLNISDDINSRNTCQFVLWDSTGIYRPQVGQQVIIQDTSVTIFAGTIDEIEETREISAYGTSLLEYSISCVDYNQICDRHHVARIYSNKTLKEIVEDIVLQDLSGEGITTTNTETGPTLIRVVYNWQSVTEAFNDLSELTGYAWYLDYSKDLHFFARETNIAPFSITDTSNNFRAIKVKNTREKYRNKQVIRAGQGLTDSRTENFIGNGTNKSFIVNYPIATEPTITLDSISKTVGIRGVETGKDWYWAKNEAIISQDDSAGAITSTQALAVTYQGYYPLLLTAQQSAEEIAARAALEGGSGVYENVEDDQDIDTSDMAIDKAVGLLRRYGRIPKIITFEIDSEVESTIINLKAGQLIDITLTTHNLSGQYLIDSVQIAESDSGQRLTYQIQALDGESQGGWAEFFRKLAGFGRRFVIRENEVSSNIRSVVDIIACDETFTITSAAPESRIGYAIIGYSEVA